ncbi:GntR family transcriptional regulator [Herbaspirillum lusitanum]|uniref:CadC n=1 Tax=Pseudomonas putida TaxID=303 RepID=H9A574_PSEPU|nr:amidohydrolase family protein [Herbaspirillum lusitanum]AFD29750.1 CadC [Pseudomonas putida]MCW5297779.1 GntR family transcriptional regulator [Herbaspirillum lusitanum]
MPPSSESHHADSIVNGAPLCAAPLSSLITPRVILPPNACDSHFHIFGPEKRYPYSRGRIYTPPDCLLTDYLALHKSLGLTRCVLIQPSVYGSDNTALLDGLKTLDGAGRGVVVLNGRESASELRDMDALGVRGVRVNLVDVKAPSADMPIESLLRMQDRVASLGWHLELLVHVDNYPNLDEALDPLEVQVVFGHMGYLSRGVSPDHPGMKAMLALLQAGRAWAKITGPYRIGTEGPPYDTAGHIANWLAQTSMDRLVWGSDWPHVMVKGHMPHDTDLLNAVAEWIPGEGPQRALFSDNPAQLYGWI